MARDTSKDMQYALEDSGFGSLLDAGFQGFGGDPSTEQKPSYIKHLLPEMPDMSLPTPTEFVEMGDDAAYIAHQANFKDLEEGEGLFGALVNRNEMKRGYDEFQSGIFREDGTLKHIKTTDKNYDEFSKFNKDFNRAYYHQNVDKDKYPTYTSFINDYLSGIGGGMEQGNFELYWEDDGTSGYSADKQYMPVIKWGDSASEMMNAYMIADYQSLKPEQWAEKYAPNSKDAQKTYDNFGDSDLYKYLDKYLGHVIKGDTYTELSGIDKITGDYKDYEYEE